MKILVSLLILPLSFPGSVARYEEMPPGVLAQGNGVEITERSFNEYLTALYRNDDMGKALLQQLVRETAIQEEEERRGIRVSQTELEKSIDRLEQRLLVESGAPITLKEYLRQQQINEQDFLEALRLSIAHEMMARQDFDIPGDREIAAEKLNIWLNEAVEKVEVHREGLPPGVLFRLNERDITAVYFGRRLCSMLSRQEAASLLTEMIGIRLISIKGKQMGIALKPEDLDREIRDREAMLKSMQGLTGITYAQYLSATKGVTLAEYKESEKFQGEVLLKKICESQHHEAYLQSFYEENRDFFNRRLGRAARLSTIFLRAVQYPNQFVRRSFDEAMDELEAIKARLDRGEVTFENMVRIYSEDDSKQSGGDLGFIPPDKPGWEAIAEAALKTDEGALLGPCKTPEGCHLFRVTAQRTEPTYEAIHDEVVREARQRFYEDLLGSANIQRRF